jgi:hypothetical protein
VAVVITRLVDDGRGSSSRSTNSSGAGMWPPLLLSLTISMTNYLLSVAFSKPFYKTRYVIYVLDDIYLVNIIIDNYYENLQFSVSDCHL